MKEKKMKVKLSYGPERREGCKMVVLRLFLPSFLPLFSWKRLRSRNNNPTPCPEKVRVPGSGYSASLMSFLVHGFTLGLAPPSMVVINALHSFKNLLTMKFIVPRKFSVKICLLGCQSVVLVLVRDCYCLIF